MTPLIAPSILSADFARLGDDVSAVLDKSRKIMNKNHPDKLAATNPDAAVIAEAERRTREVLSAYELLKARRSIR